MKFLGVCCAIVYPIRMKNVGKIGQEVMYALKLKYAFHWACFHEIHVL
jgi:hypothetical protein